MSVTTETEPVSADVWLYEDDFAIRAGQINRSLLKRAFDVVVATLAIILLSPLLFLIALAIRLDSRGPIIFRQERYGHGGRFTILKFRTMTADACLEDFRQATPGDDRLTGIGKWLRRHNLDELPQLINVLRGDMALVGPRPHPVALDDRFAKVIPQQMTRYSVPPGITGWAQIHGHRGETPGVADMAARVNYDLDYIRRWSLWFDFIILVRTAFDRRSFKNAV